MLTQADLTDLKRLRCSFFERALVAGKHRHPDAAYLRQQFALLDRVIEEVERPRVLDGGGPRDAA